MNASWRHSLVYLTVIAVVGISVVFGALFISATNMVTRQRAQEESTENIGRLLDIVESTVGIACFVGDQALAQEVAHGLLKNPEVLGVVIRNDKQELAHTYRVLSTPQLAEQAVKARLSRVVRSPFNPNERVGEIYLDPNPDEIDRQIKQDVSFVGLMLTLQIAGTIAAIILVLIYLIVKPIKRMSDRLHQMDAAAGNQLRIPKGHANTEIGRLANDINALAGHLMASLEDERELRHLSEIGEKKYQAIFANAETGIFIANRESAIESFNPAFSRLLDMHPDTMERNGKKHIADLAWCIPARLSQLICDCIDNNKMCSDDLELGAGNKLTRWLNLVLSPIGDNMVQGVVVDVTERKLSESTALRQAVTDPLTGLANRHGFGHEVMQLIKQHENDPGKCFALMLINLDGFKRVNEALGMPMGDAVLKVAALRLNNCLKSGDTVARIGGDEYAAILPNATGKELSSVIAERIISVLRENFDVHSTPIKLGASIGIAFFPSDGKDLPALLRDAELALSRAKSTGGNQFNFFDTGMTEAAERRRAMETDMHQALPRNEFELFYQPIVDLVSNQLAGAEALIRWHHPEKGLIPPDAFIPLAEETGFIVELGSWILETASRQLAEWQTAGKDYYISINVSGHQIPNGITPEKLAETIRRYGINPSRLALEITEGVLLADVNQALSWLQAVRELGCRIYLDDFGTGYSSLSYLKRFPVTTVKVDKSFVRDMSKDSSDLALVEAIVAMARSLGLNVVAEGVETMAQLELLRQMNCRSIQGYYFSKPVPIEQFAKVATRVEALLASTKNLTAG